MINADVIQHQIVKDIRLYFNTLHYRTLHFHKDMEILWALDGGFEILIDNKQKTVEEGKILLLNVGQLHEIKAASKGCTMLAVHLSPNLVAKEVPALEHIRFEESFLHTLPEETYKGIKTLLLETMWQYLKKPQYYELYCTNNMRMFVYFLLTGLPYHVLTEKESLVQEKHNERLQSLVRFVEQNYMYNIRLSDFARQEGRSLNRMSHFIKSTMGQSFREYVDLVRFNAACTMMVTGQYKMLDICMECGFSDYKYFSKAFLSRMGLTPEMYYKQLSRNAGDETAAEHNIYSQERFYTPEQSIGLCEKFREKYIK